MTGIKRNVPPKRRRTGPPRKNRVIDREYLAWIRTQPCAVKGSPFGCCGYKITAHHLREFGSPKDDHRVVALCYCHHLHDWGVYSIERLGKAKFELAHTVNLQQLALDYWQRYRQERGKC